MRRRRKLRDMFTICNFALISPKDFFFNRLLSSRWCAECRCASLTSRQIYVPALALMCHSFKCGHFTCALLVRLNGQTHWHSVDWSIIREYWWQHTISTLIQWLPLYVLNQSVVESHSSSEYYLIISFIDDYLSSGGHFTRSYSKTKQCKI